jgi:hypothetical protein
MRQFFSVLFPCSIMKRRNLISPLVLLAMIFVVSCSKEGPAGAAGPEGPPGPAGNGSSDVIYSDWLDVAYKPDTIHTAGGQIDTVGYYATIDVPKLTVAMLNTADVKVFINTNDASDPVIYPLPYSARSGLYIQVSAYLQKLEFYSNADVGTVLDNGKKYQQYRYMIVPGNAVAKAGASINWSDYAEAKTYLGLKD